jgi:hypothetical protein
MPDDHPDDTFRLLSIGMRPIGAVQQFMLQLYAMPFLRGFFALFQPTRSCKRAAFIARCDPTSRGRLQP